MISDSMGGVLGNARISLPGVDTLFTDTEGKAVFAAVSESPDLIYKVDLEGYQSHDGTLAFTSDSFMTPHMLPRSVIFEIGDPDNTSLNGAIATIMGYEPTQSNEQGIAVVSGPFPRLAGYLSKSRHLDAGS